MSSGRCKLKEQGDATTHLSERLQPRTLTEPCDGKDAEQWERSLTAGGSEKWHSHFEGIRQFLTKLNILSPYDPALMVLGIYPKELKTRAHPKPAHRCS